MNPQIRTFVLRKKAIVILYYLQGHFMVSIPKHKREKSIDIILLHGLDRIESILESNRNISLKSYVEKRQVTGGTTSTEVWDRLTHVVKRVNLYKCEVIELCLYFYVKDKLGTDVYKFFHLDTWEVDF